jgi:hypothetical protein
MIWVAIAVGGFAAWLSVVVFFVALCSAATRADRRANARPASATTNVIAYLSSRDRRRSLSSLPSVWHVGQ